MLSPSERRILGELAHIITERDRQRLFRMRQRGKQRRPYDAKIAELENEIRNYLEKVSDNYRRVLKHRVKNKANRSVQDLLLVFKTYEYLEIDLSIFLSPETYAEMKYYFPKEKEYVYWKPVSYKKSVQSMLKREK